MDSDDAVSGGTSSDSESSGEQVGQKRKRQCGNSAAREIAAKIVRAAYNKRKDGILCPVCQKANKRGKVADLKALEQHCATKSENMKKHRSFLKVLADEMRDVRKEPRRSAQRHEILDQQGLALQKCVTPYLLIIRNVETEV